MAEQEQSKGSETQEPSGPAELRQDELIEKLVPDPAAPPDVIVLVGFLGKSSRAGYVRLYITPKLNDYFEIREKDVVLTQSLATELNPLGGTVVWVRREADLLHTRTTAAQAAAEFLGGPIMDSFSGTPSLGGLTGAALRRGWLSWTFLWFCDPGCCVTNCVDTVPCGLTLNEPPVTRRTAGLCCPF